MSKRFLAQIGDDGVVQCVVMHSGPPSDDHGMLEISEAEYAAACAGKTVRKTHSGFSIEARVASYNESRSMAYPTIGDQLDALWKGGDALISMQQKIFAVKAAYPKEEV